MSQKMWMRLLVRLFCEFDINFFLFCSSRKSKKRNKSKKQKAVLTLRLKCACFVFKPQTSRQNTSRATAGAPGSSCCPSCGGESRRQFWLSWSSSPRHTCGASGSSPSKLHCCCTCCRSHSSRRDSADETAPGRRPIQTGSGKNEKLLTFLNQPFILKRFLSCFTEYQLHEPDGGLGSFFFQLATCSAAELISGSVQHGLLTP